AGVDVRVGGAQPGVDRDTVANGQPRILGQLDVGPDPDRDDRQVGREQGAVGEPYRGEQPAAVHELGNLGAEAELDAVGPVKVGEDLGHLVAEHAAQRQRVDLHDGDLGTVCSGRRGRLQTDPAGTDDDHASASTHVVEQPVSLGKGAEIAHAG